MIDKKYFGAQAFAFDLQRHDSAPSAPQAGWYDVGEDPSAGIVNFTANCNANGSDSATLGHYYIKVDVNGNVYTVNLVGPATNDATLGSLTAPSDDAKKAVTFDFTAITGGTITLGEGFKSVACGTIKDGVAVSGFKEGDTLSTEEGKRVTINGTTYTARSSSESSFIGRQVDTSVVPALCGGDIYVNSPDKDFLVYVDSNTDTTKVISIKGSGIVERSGHVYGLAVGPSSAPEVKTPFESVFVGHIDNGVKGTFTVNDVVFGVTATTIHGTSPMIYTQIQDGKVVVKQVIGFRTSNVVEIDLPSYMTGITVANTALRAKAGSTLECLMKDVSESLIAFVTKAEDLSIAESDVRIAKDADTTSTIVAKTDNDNSVTVDVADGKYTIKGLNNGDVVTIDGVDYTYSENGDIKTFKSDIKGWTLGTNQIEFTIADGSDTTTATPIAGIDFTASTGVQYIDLGATVTKAWTNDEINAKQRLTAVKELTAGNYYLAYEADSKTLSIKQADTATAFKETATDSYTGGIGLDVSALANTAISEEKSVTLVLRRDSGDGVVPKVVLTGVTSEYMKVTGVTDDDRINNVSMDGAGTSELTVVGKFGGDSLTSISGLANGRDLGSGTRLPDGIEVTLKNDATSATVNDQTFFVKAADNNKIKTTYHGSYFYNGTATLANDGGQTASLPFADGKAVTLAASDGTSAITTDVVVENGIVKTIGASTALSDKAVLTVTQNGVSVRTAATGTFKVNGKEYTGTAALEIKTSESSSVLYDGTVSISGSGTVLEIGDCSGTALVKNQTIKLSGDNASATVKAASGNLVFGADAITLGVGTGIEGVPSADADNLTLGEAGTYSINGIAFTASSVNETAYVNSAGALAVSGNITTSTTGKKYVVGGTTYDDVSADVDLTNLGATLDTAGEYVKVAGHDKLTATTLSTGQALMIDTNGAITSSLSYAVGDSFTLGETTYNFTESKTAGNIKLVIRNGGKYTGAYDLPATTITAITIKDVAGSKEDTITGILPTDRPSTPLALTKTTFADAAESGGEDAMATATTLYYNKDGEPSLTSDSTTVATLTRPSAAATDNYTLKVTGKLSSDVNITDVTANLTDSGTGTTYVLDDEGTAFQVSGTASVNASDVVTSVTGVIIIIKGDMKAKASAATYDVSSEDNENTITFVAGNALNNTKVNTRSGLLTITESSNTADTKVDYDGTVTGLDGNTTLTGVPAGVTINTNGSGTVSLNGISFTTDDESGITVSQDSTNPTQLNITGLAAGKKITNVTAGKAIKIGSNNPITGISSGAVINPDGSVTLGNGQYAGVNYGGNIKNTGSTEITVANDGSISTAGGDISVTGAYEGKTITTAADGTATINGRSYKVSDNDTGITYMAAAKGISAFSGLRQGATLKLEGSFSGFSITNTAHNNETFTDIKSVDGIEITLNKEGAMVVTLDKVGEQFTGDDATYRLNSAAGEVVVDEDGAIGGLVNGTKLTITDKNAAFGTTTMEVKDGILVITKSNGDTFTYKQEDPSVPFTVKANEGTSVADITFTVTGASTDTTEQAATEGLEIGGRSVDTVTNGMFVDKNGKATTDESKAAAEITITDSGNSINYKAKDKGKQELNISDTNGVDWNIDTQASNGKTHVEAGTSAKPVNNSVNVETGSGKSEVAVYSNSDSKIQGGSGNLDATVGGKGDHNVTAGSGSKNEFKDFGTGENVLTGGSGKNIFESSNENGKLVAGTGKNTFKTTKNVTNKVEGFTYGRDEASIDSAISDLSKFIVGDGTINYDGKAANGELDVSSGTGTGNIFAVTILDSTGKKTNVGWTGEEGGTIDASSETRSLVLIGNQNGDAKDILMGGKGRDVIYAGEGDSVTGGEGRNELHLNGSGIAVGFGRTGAKDEVTGFKSGFDNDEVDSILLMDAYAAEELNLAFDGKDAVLKSNGTSMTLDSIQKNTATNAVELLIGGAKVAAIEKDTTAKITEADYADVYFGTGSAGIDFEAVSDDLTIGLSDTSRFRNIASVTGGAGNTLLMGGGSKVTLVSGGGSTSLWGGTGNAMLVGADNAKDEFFFFGESGKDTVSGFTAGTEDTSDVLNLNGSAITDIVGTSAGVEISTTKDSKVLLQGLKPNDKLQWVSGDSKGVAKIGSKNEANSFTYEADVTNYFGGNKIDTLKIFGESSTVWLDRVGSSIEIIDASGSTGNNLLAGSSESQTIKGGRGNNSLWGGAGGNDILTGGTGHNEFYFGIGEGSDIITQSNDTDKVMLYNVKVSDLDTAGMKDGNMVIALKDGSSLTIQNYDRQGATTFQLADGTYSYDKSTGTWKESK